MMVFILCLYIIILVRRYLREIPCIFNKINMSTATGKKGVNDIFVILQESQNKNTIHFSVLFYLNITYKYNSCINLLIDYVSNVFYLQL